VADVTVAIPCRTPPPLPRHCKRLIVYLQMAAGQGHTVFPPKGQHELGQVMKMNYAHASCLDRGDFKKKYWFHLTVNHKCSRTVIFVVTSMNCVILASEWYSQAYRGTRAA